MTQKEIFNLWNSKKQKIDQESKFNHPQPYPKAGEVWMTALGKNIGFEQNGTGVNFSRPVLVLKKFNNQMYCIIPLSTKQKGLDFYFNFTDPFGYPVSAILAQIRLISIKRFYRKMYLLSSEELAVVMDELYKLLTK